MLELAFTILSLLQLLLITDAYFRNTGLERSKGLSIDLEWFSQQDIAIPLPSNPGVTYVKYLEELAETSPSLFLSHFYNIYFSHIAGGQVIAKQVSFYASVHCFVSCYHISVVLQ